MLKVFHENDKRANFERKCSCESAPSKTVSSSENKILRKKIGSRAHSDDFTKSIVFNLAAAATDSIVLTKQNHFTP